MNSDRPNRRHFLETTALMLLASPFVPGGLAEQQADDPIHWTAMQAVDALKRGRITARELVQAALTRARRLRYLNLFTTMDPDQALAAAGAIDRRRAAGQDVGPIAGLPLIIKDNIDSAALPTTAASTAFAGWRPKQDAPVLAALFQAGAVMIGKANMHEMAFGVTSNNPVYGPVGNPYNPKMIPGGSSGGTAAAISARVVTGGLGSDTGGSCRVPAALCGCVGFRPTFGRYPTAGIIPLTWTLDTPGPLARTVDDVALLDGICSKRPANRAEPRIAGIRLAIPRSMYQDLDPALSRTVDATLEAVRKAGAILVDADIAHLRIQTLDDAQGPRAVAGYLIDHGSRVSVFEIFEKVKGPAERALLLAQLNREPSDAGAFVQSLVVQRHAYLASVASYFAENNISALLIPTTPLPARPIGQDETVELNGRQVSTFTTYIRNCGFGSGAGLPCLSVPVGLTADGLPVGMELVGRAESDGTVLALGKALEQLVGVLPAPVL
jgi:Asp-tRNA(Asn)/Glu-tRNA(Gln) amidotransferase A subunit family amidase